jgi:hypothetical protein
MVGLEGAVAGGGPLNFLNMLLGSGLAGGSS